MRFSGNHFLQEMKRVHEKENLSLGQLLQVVTINGAKALGMEDETGSLVSGKKADIVGLNLVSRKNPLFSLLEGKVKMTMVDGKTVFTR